MIPIPRHFYIDDESTAKLLNAQFELIWEIIRYYVFYRLFKESFSNQATAAGEPWLVCTQNAYQDSVARHWAMLFSHSKNEGTRCFALLGNSLTNPLKILRKNKLQSSKNSLTIIPELSGEQNNLLETILSYAELETDKFGTYWEKLIAYRDKRLIHYDLNSTLPIFYPAITTDQNNVLIKTTFGFLNFLNDLCQQLNAGQYLIRYSMITVPWQDYIQKQIDEAKNTLSNVIKKNWIGRVPF